MNLLLTGAKAVEVKYPEITPKDTRCNHEHSIILQSHIKKFVL